MSIGIYLRVSSKTQDTRSQEPDLQTWAKAQPDEVTWFRDKFTGTVVTRPGLDRLLADVRRGKIKKVVVWRLDRLGRTAKGLLILLDELKCPFRKRAGARKYTLWVVAASLVPGVAADVRHRGLFRADDCCLPLPCRRAGVVLFVVC